MWGRMASSGRLLTGLPNLGPASRPVNNRPYSENRK